jgi:peptide/nickel transport system permease protein
MTAVAAGGDRAFDAAPGPGRLTERALRNPVLRVVVRRLLLAVPLLFVVSALSFLLSSLAPASVVDSMLPDATFAQRAALSHKLGLDQPVYEQYWHWLVHALHGNFGASLTNGQSVAALIGQRFPVTISLVIPTIVIMFIVGVWAGAFSAIRGGALGRLIDTLTLVGFALPGFWVGAVLVAFFADKFHLLPAIGYVSPSVSISQWAKSLVLPVCALSLLPIAVVARQTREAMMDVLASEHVRMAWANGIPPRTIYYRLALKNASIRALTVGGLQTVGLLTGTLFVEQVFTLPGLGSALVMATSTSDLLVTQGIVVFFTLLIVLINLIVDLLYTALDPRVRTS